MARYGKIARLPRIIRDELNQRVSDGQTGPKILKWLNALPEVKTLVSSEYGGCRVNATNLHEWKERGYRQWLIHQETLLHAAELASDAAALAQAAPSRLSDHLATVLTCRYAAELSTWSHEDDPALLARLKILGQIAQNAAELRRGDHEVSRLQFDETRLDWERDKTLADIILYFRRWAQFPKVREALLAGDPPPNGLDPLVPLLAAEPPLSRVKQF